MAFFHSIEFYVILTVVAAAIVAWSAKPKIIGAVKELLLAGDLIPVEHDADTDDREAIDISCTPTGRVIILRRGLHDIRMSGAVSLALKIKGYDIRIEERLTPGSAYDDPAAAAMFAIDTLVPGEYYHIHYNSTPTGRSAMFTFHTRPGLSAHHELNQ